jgi:hypothetical protein
VRAAFEIIHEMRHDVRGSGLARELKIFARQHVTIQSKSQFHFITPTCFYTDSTD